MTQSPSPLARELVRARQDGILLDATAWKDAVADAAAAYAVQRETDRLLQAGQPAAPRSWKSGGPRPGPEQTHAALPAAGVWPSPAEAQRHPFHLRLIEAEIAFRLGHDVSADAARDLTLDGVAALLDAMAVSIEVVDSRWQQGADAPALLRLADLQSHGALVLGEWQALRPLDWAAQACEVQIGSGAASRHRGSHPMGNPLAVVPEWLRHAAQETGVVPAGTVVTTGTWCGMREAAAGDAVTVRFDGIGAARIQL